ncbi:MAG TPA: Rv1535 domain-containing protein [Mycobacterium sp.]|nr:Rv1535 domain-containing protein [Mycobacterium sp.]
MKSTTGSLADPLASGAAGLLAIPLIELYAVLWRFGLVEVHADRTTHRRLRPLPAPLAFYCRARGLRRQPRRSQPRLSPAPAPTRPGRAECNREAG